MADAETPSGFDINGEVYEVPTLDSFDMDEAQILYDLSGVTLEDFIPPHPEASNEEKAGHYQLQILRVRDPSFKRALVHVAYRRRHPEYDRAELDKGIGKLNATDVSIAVLTKGDEEDPSQDSPSKPDEKSNTNGTSDASSSGSPSTSDSERPVLSLAPIGTSPLATYSPESAPLPSAS